MRRCSWVSPAVRILTILNGQGEEQGTYEQAELSVWLKGKRHTGGEEV
jgi:hypothetical protein